MLESDLESEDLSNLAYLLCHEKSFWIFINLHDNGKKEWDALSDEARTHNPRHQWDKRFCLLSLYEQAIIMNLPWLSSQRDLIWARLPVHLLGRDKSGGDGFTSYVLAEGSILCQEGVG